MDILGGGMNVVAFAEALLKLTSDPETFKANLDVAKEIQARLDAKDISLRQREDAVAQREQAAADLDKRDAEVKLKLANLSDYAEKIDLQESELAAAKASHTAEIAKTTKALDDRRLDILNTQQTVDAKAAEQQKTSVDLQRRAVALDAQRTAVEARDAAVKEAEAALAAKQERLTKALQGA